MSANGELESEARREQSTIAFPYLDLDAAIEVAAGVYNRSGLGLCDLDELAAQMNQTMSGAFRLKTGTAKIFDLIERDGRSGVKLSDLGRQVVNSESARFARVESFLRVPLYSAIYDKYKGHLLPPARALEREMQSLGVSSKQTDKARQAFERSARQAGFFESGEDRLVRPKVESDTKPVSDNIVEKNQSPIDVRLTSEIGPGKNHPLIQGLLMTLPPPGEKWDAESRASWLRMAASIFDMIYSGGPALLAVVMSASNKAATDQW